MTFERTVHGQQNRALFLDVDFICYIEGEDDTEESDDIAFWTSVFDAVRPDLKVHFVCRGGKPVLEGLARSIVFNDMQAVLVAMDADYSRLFPDRIVTDRRVLYTYGYSWENDVYYEDHCLAVFRRITRRASIPNAVKEFHSEGSDRFADQARRVMIADFLGLAARTSVIPRKSPGRIVGRESDGRPYIVKKQCLLLTSVGNCAPCRKPLKEYSEIPDCAKRYLVGKVAELSARYLMNACISGFSRSREVAELHFRQLAIWTFESALASTRRNPVLNFHRHQAGAI